MSHEQAQKVMSRVATSTSFRKLLVRNPNQALKSYRLNKEEKIALKDIASLKFDLSLDSDGRVQLYS